MGFWDYVSFYFPLNIGKARYPHGQRASQNIYMTETKHSIYIFANAKSQPSSMRETTGIMPFSTRCIPATIFTHSALAFLGDGSRASGLTPVAVRHRAELYEGVVFLLAALANPVRLVILSDVQRIIVPQSSWLFHIVYRF